MTRTDCPSAAELSAFHRGELPESDLEEVADHLEACARCEAAVRALYAEPDPVITSLRHLAETAPAFGPRPGAPLWVDGHEILGELGRGGMGIVYKARHAQLGREVALKMLLGGGFAQHDERERFRAEARAAARLQHPNIVQVFDVGEWRAGTVGPPVPYFTLEFVGGGNLSGRLAGKPQPPAQAARWLLDLARAVHYAHTNGVIHRDLKPSNVLLTRDGQLKLCDFGVAKLLTGSDLKTLSGLLVGTPEYMAPEQAAGDARGAGPAADTYALGAILYTCLTGRPPFQGASVLETLTQVRTQEAVRPSRLRPGVPRDLDTICLKCLEKEPSRRYASVAALADDLERFLNGQTILARPAGVVERGWKWARRRPAVALLSAAVVLVSVLGFALVTWRWRAEVAAKEQEQLARHEADAKSAELALDQGLALCEQGEVGRGLLHLADSLAPAQRAGLHHLDRAIRVNLADWHGQLSRPRREPSGRRLRLQHSAEVLCLVFSPDGQALVSAGKHRSIKFWNVATGQEARPALTHDRTFPEDCWIGRVAFHPTDPNTLVAVDGQGQAIFWDVARGQRQGQPLRHPSGRMIWGVAFSPDGKRLVTGCDDGAARRWDVATRRLIGAPLWHTHSPEGYYTLALSPDGKTLVTGGIDGRAVRWDMASGRRLDPPQVYDSPVDALAFSRDDRKVITGTQNGTLHIWEPESGRVFALPPQGTEVKSVAVSPDERTLATGTTGGVVRLWDLSTFRQIGQTFKLREPVRALAFDPGGRTLAVGHTTGMISLWGVPQAKAAGALLRMQGSVHCVAFSPTDRALLLAGSNRGAQWWNLTDGRAQGPSMHRDRYEPGDTVPSWDGRRTFRKLKAVEATALSPDGRVVATAGWSGSEGHPKGRAELWDAVTGELLRRTPDQPKPLVGLAFSPDSKRLLTWDAERDGALLWDVATLQHGPLVRSLRTSIRCAAFSADGQTVLLGCGDKTARLWGLERNEEVGPAPRPEHGYPITAVAFVPHGPGVVTGCYAGTVRLWDAAGGALLNDVRGNGGEITAIVVSRDGRTLVTASHDGTARFWDAESGRQLGPTLRHGDAVLSVAFDPDAQTIVTGTKDGMIHRWHIPAAPQEGSPEQIRQWIEERTGLRRDERGLLHTVQDD